MEHVVITYHACTCHFTLISCCPGLGLLEISDNDSLLHGLTRTWADRGGGQGARTPLFLVTIVGPPPWTSFLLVDHKIGPPPLSKILDPPLPVQLTHLGTIYRPLYTLYRLVYPWCMGYGTQYMRHEKRKYPKSSWHSGGPSTENIQAYTQPLKTHGHYSQLGRGLTK